MAVSPDRKMVYVALGDDDAVAQVEVATRTRRRTIPVGRDPEQVAVSPDGKILYVSTKRPRRRPRSISRPAARSSSEPSGPNRKASVSRPMA
jgi:YVTN family beta-propeller protein